MPHADQQAAAVYLPLQLPRMWHCSLAVSCMLQHTLPRAVISLCGAHAQQSGREQERIFRALRLGELVGQRGFKVSCAVR